MNISVVGTGYVGLVAGGCLAEAGHEVVCIGSNPLRVTRQSSGGSSFSEPGLTVLLTRMLEASRLTFAEALNGSVQAADVILLTHPAQSSGESGAVLQSILSFARNLGPLLAKQKRDGEHGYRVIVNQCTLHVGAARLLRELLESSGLVAGQDFDVVSNPAFLRQGTAIRDFMEPDRIVVGTSSPRALDVMKRLYAAILRVRGMLTHMDDISAELTQLAASAYLATKVSFINQVAQLCARVDADVEQVRLGMGSDSRIGMLALSPSLGFGGASYPESLRAMLALAEQHDYDFSLLKCVQDANRRQVHLLLEMLRQQLGPDLTGRRIAIWGLSFKANTADVRESPAHTVVRDLVRAGAEVAAYDPAALGNSLAELRALARFDLGMYECLAGADALVICTEWRQFRESDLPTVRELLKTPLVLDGRNLFDPSRMASIGFRYHCVGRPSKTPRNPKHEYHAQMTSRLSDPLGMTAAATSPLV